MKYNLQINLTQEDTQDILHEKGKIQFKRVWLQFYLKETVHKKNKGKTKLIPISGVWPGIMADFHTLFLTQIILI